ncbi:glutamine-rich protein 2 isoform X2 [Ambystoma mexicanum]|uniref:glutamine-rich protein 2 isoform X2 n=1 Tax=Ambystoma mexicanum TaxID=8296 RepID=UPI0037E8BA8E
MPSKLSLFDLTNLSIGTPEVGAVNFNALHTLLHAILKQLNIQDVQTEISDEERDLHKPPASLAPKVVSPPPTTEAPPGKVAIVYHQLEKKVQEIERQMEAFRTLPTGTDLMQRSKTDAPTPSTPVGDMWQMMQMKRKVEGNADGITKAMAILQDLLNEINVMKSALSETHQDGKQNMQQALKEMEEKLKLYPSPEELKNVVEWEVLHETLVKSRTSSQTTGAHGTAPGTTSGAHGTQQTTPTAGADSAHVGAQPSRTSAQHHGSPTGEEHGHTPTNTSPPGTSFSRTSSASERFPDAVEALRNIGQLTDQITLIKQQIDDLEKKKADRSELQEMKQITEMAKEKFSKLPADLDKRLVAFEKNMEEAHEDRQKLQRLEKIFDPMASQTGPKVEGENQIGLQLAFLSSTVQDIEKELKELRSKQDQGKAKMEQSVTQASVHLQDQLDKLRSILQTMVSSSSTLLALSMQPEGTAAEGPELASLTGGSDPQHPGPPSTPDVSERIRTPSSRGPPVHGQGTCPACSIDVGEQVSQLVIKYEQLQDLVNTFMSRQTDGKQSRKSSQKSQDGQLLSHIQCTIHHLQEECEKLNKTTGNLIDDHQQKQKHIDIIYQSLEKLEEKKADKDHIEMEIDVKADKRALEGKVSRTQFDATNEQLNKMMQDLLEKVTGQEQDWQKVVDKISLEMETKLDRLELDPFKHQLEDRWKAIHKQLKDRAPTYEADDAAGIRKQLIARFHCISCDRPVDMMVPGPQVITVPSMPSLPCHRSNRPYTVYELEQVRQQNKSMKSGLFQSRFEAAQLEKSVQQLRRIHSRMRMEIEKVQLHFGGSVRASTQAIREILHARCISLGQYRRRYESKHSVDRIPDMSDYGHMGTPRSCGGSHTMTFPHRRYTRLQNINPNQCVQPEEENILALLKQEEVDILGLDGHIYRGRMDHRFPAIPVKEDSKIRRKSSQNLLKPEANNLLERPRSAKSSSSSHGLLISRSLNGRPVSSQGRLSQINLLIPAPVTTPLPEEAKEEPPPQAQEEEPPPQAQEEELPPQARESLEVHIGVSLNNVNDANEDEEEEEEEEEEEGRNEEDEEEDEDEAEEDEDEEESLS